MRIGFGLLLTGWLGFTIVALAQQPGDTGADAAATPPLSQPAEDTAEPTAPRETEAAPTEDPDPLSQIDQFFGSGNASDGTSSDQKVDAAQVDRGDSDPVGQLIDPPSLFGETPLAEQAFGDAQLSRPPASDEPLDLVDGYPAARQLALLRQRPLLVIFGADWCVWCRKLEQELASADAETIRRHWVVAKVDVDEQPQLAQQMDVGSLPAIRVVDAEGGVLASRTGYTPSDQLQSWLDEKLEQADPNVQRVLLSSDPPSQAEVAELVAMLQQRSPSVRASASRRLREHRSIAAPAVVDRFRATSLSGQLTALEILEAWDAPVAGLDPWLPDTINPQSLEPLLEWVRSVPTDRESDQDAAVGPIVDPQAAAAILRQLLDASPARRQQITHQAIAGGLPVAEQAQQLLHSLDSLTDDQRQLLRQVRYQILAGPATRIESAGLLESVALLDGPTRREAAEKLMQSLGSQDQPLIDDLSRDADPLVRELVVSVQSRIGALKSDRLQRMLSDDSPSVRTAVLRELAENPQDEVTESLVAYLNTESDEDLLVYATKTLGQLAANDVASQALADLMGDSRWRVRAAALDASRQFFEGGDSMMSWFSGSARTVPSSLAESVLTALDDDDPFVVSQAAMTLPYILSRDTAEKVATYMLQDEANFSAVYESIEEYQRERRLEPLVDLGLRWLEEDDSQQTAAAARLITRIAPTKMRYRLVSLLDSPQRSTRIAALQALIPCLVEFRDEQLTYERAHSGTALGFTAKKQLDALPLIRPFPDSFRPAALEVEPALADQPPADLFESSPESSGNQSDDEPADTSSIDVVDDFFGPPAAASPADEAPAVAADQLLTESETIDRESSPDEDEQAEPSDGLFGWAMDLLGGRSSDGPQLPRQPSASASPNISTWDDLEQQRIGLGSYWIERWQTRHDSIKRPAWVRQCESPVRELVDSQDPVEQIWALAASVAMGNTDHLTRLQQQWDSDQLPDDAPRLTELVSWLPAAERLQWLTQADVNWNGPPDESWQPLRAATQLDHPDVAQWIYDQIATHEIDDDQSLATINELITHAMLGRVTAEERSIHSADKLNRDAELPLSIPNQPPLLAQVAMAQWLIAEYQQATSESQKSVLLAALSTASRRHAFAEALSILDESQVDGRLTQVATALALSDLRSLSAERAVVLLSHPIASVAEQALNRLVLIDTQGDPSSSILGIATLYYETPRNFAFQELRRPLPLDSLERFASDEPLRLTAFADVLRLSAGDDLDPHEILKRLQDWELALPVVAVALAEAGRTDDAAMQVYTSCAETAEAHYAGSLYRALRPLKDDRISVLRRQLLKTHDGFMP